MHVHTHKCLQFSRSSNLGSRIIALGLGAYRLRILGLSGAFLTDFLSGDVLDTLGQPSFYKEEKENKNRAGFVPTHQKLQDSDQTLQFMWKYRSLALEGQLGAS